MAINVLILLIVIGLLNSVVGMDMSMQERRKRSLADAEVILHIGPPKTATSHIQGALHRLREELGHEGYCWPIADGDTHKLHAIGNAFKAGHAGPDQQVALVQHCLRSGQKVIFSSEKMSAVDTKAGFEHIRKLFSGRRIHIVAAYRESLTVSYSYYNQCGRYKPDVLPFSNYLTRNYDHLFAHMFHSSFANYAQEFGKENMTIIDFNGVMAVKKDMAHVFLCEMLGAQCNMEIIPDERSHPSLDLLTHYLFILVRNLAKTLQCKVSLSKQKYRKIVDGYEELDLKALPVNELRFEGMAELARRVDAEIRRDFSDIMLYNNREAAMSALNKFSVREVDANKFHDSVVWTKWLWAEVQLLQTEGVFTNCAVSGVIKSNGGNKGNKGKHEDDDDDDEEDDDSAEDDDE